MGAEDVDDDAAGGAEWGEAGGSKMKGESVIVVRSRARGRTHEEN